MKREISWLLAGAAFTLCAGVSVAVAADARDEAERDSRAAAVKPDKTEKIERREVRIYRRDDNDHGPNVRIFRRGDGDDRHVFTMSRTEGRADHLKALLQLRPDQETALKAFMEATSPQRHDHANVVRFDTRHDKKGTLDRLAEMEAKSNATQAATKKKIDAMRAFYNQLDAKQKAAFDEMPMLLVAGPEIGPMLLPGPMPIVMHMRRGEHFDMPPLPPVPPVPPVRPRS